MPPTKNSKTFYRVTNKDIYDSIQVLHSKNDEICSTLEVHSARISAVQKVAWSTAGALVTIASAIIIFVITSI